MRLFLVSLVRQEGAELKQCCLSELTWRISSIFRDFNGHDYGIVDIFTEGKVERAVFHLNRQRDIIGLPLSCLSKDIKIADDLFSLHQDIKDPLANSRLHILSKLEGDGIGSVCERDRVREVAVASTLVEGVVLCVGNGDLISPLPAAAKASIGLVDCAVSGGVLGAARIHCEYDL